MFVTEEPIPVTVEGDSRTIYVRRRLSMKRKAIVMDAAMHITVGDDTANTFAYGSFKVALARAFFMTYSTLGNPPKKYEQDDIDNLDDEDPLVAAALEKCAELWKAGSTDPKAKKESAQQKSESTASTDGGNAYDVGPTARN